MTVVTRFAPSPTGLLHLGHAFSALSAYRLAQETGGRFLLRIEDIDRTRARAAFEEAIYEDLAWLGLSWETPVRRQSGHMTDYARAVDALRARGLAYPCFCTRKDIAEEIARSIAAPHGPEGPLYPGLCRTLTEAERARRIEAGEPHALRLDAAAAAKALPPDLRFEEEGEGPGGERGPVGVDPQLLGDVVLARKDVPTSYHVAVVVDDALQGVTHVVRGQDLFHATHIHRVLQTLLDLPSPRYRHHALIRDERGARIAKRKGGHTLRALREAGETPETIRGRLGFA